MQPREGGFAQKIAIPERNLVIIDDSLTFDQAALAEPIACGWHAARVAKAHPAGFDATRALVFGGGAIGMGAALSLRAQGIENVSLVEPNEVRRDYIITRYDIHVIDPTQVSSGDDYDVVIDGVGYVATREQASEAVRPGGIIVHIGLGQDLGGLNIRRMTLQEITFTGTYTYTSQDFRDTAQAMIDGKLGDLSWAETRPLSHGAQAFQDIRSGTSQAPKIILKPTY
jgi:L-iditol 2-dehydrogenase